MTALELKIFLTCGKKRYPVLLIALVIHKAIKIKFEEALKTSRKKRNTPVKFSESKDCIQEFSLNKANGLDLIQQQFYRYLVLL